MKHEHIESYLPSWFLAPRPIPESGQKCLFSDSRDEALTRLRVSLDELVRWSEQNWVPCDARQLDEFTPEQEEHIAFIRDLIRSGLSDAQVKSLLGPLPMDGYLNPREMAFSFTYGWVVPSHYVPAQALDETELMDGVEQLSEQGDWDALQGLRDRLDELLNSNQGSG